MAEAGSPEGTRKPGGVMSLNIKERSALFAAYMSFLPSGGIFIPTSKDIPLGEDVLMLLSIIDEPDKIAVQGRIVWITPKHANDNRIQGVGVMFNDDEGGKLAKGTIERHLAGLLEVSRATHTM